MSQCVTRDMTHVTPGNTWLTSFIFYLWSSPSMWHLEMAHTWKFWTSYIDQQLPKAQLTSSVANNEFWGFLVTKMLPIISAEIFVDEGNEEGDCPSQPPIKCKILPERQQRPPWTGELERKLVLPESDFMTRLHKSRPLQPFLAKTGRLTILANNPTCSGN